MSPVTRRTFIGSMASAAALCAKAPANSADCHLHIYESRFPVDPKSKLRPPDATVADYRQVQERLGTTRCVIVQPSTYGVDNRCMLQAVAQMGRSARGVAVVNSGVSDAELKRMDAGGVRGIRFNLEQAGATTLDMVEPLAKRIAPLGWHIQVNAGPEKIREAGEIWKGLPVEVVFDHLAHVPAPGGLDSAYGLVIDLLEKRKGWVKLSGVYIDSKVGPPSYSDRKAITQAYVKNAPDRLVWGTDWPHPTVSGTKPDNLVLLNLLFDWVPDEETRTRILVRNPEKLYGFS
ncbi:MAG TPA: amidohydrolase family protein [Bryobacteraceae bacterium]